VNTLIRKFTRINPNRLVPNHCGESQPATPATITPSKTTAMMRATGISDMSQASGAGPVAQRTMVAGLETGFTLPQQLKRKSCRQVSSSANWRTAS
jgi:hypothetical protein